MTVFKIGQAEIPVNSSAKGRYNGRPSLTIGVDGNFDDIRAAFEKPESLVQVEENGYETDFSAYNALSEITYKDGSFRVVMTHTDEADVLRAQVAALEAEKKTLTAEKQTLQTMVNQYAAAGKLDEATAAVALEKGLIAESITKET